MTIQTEDRKAGPFHGDGVTVNFDFGFKVFAETDVLVIQAVTATGAETEKTITTDYTVTLNPNQESSPGGRVTMLVAPPAGQTITLTSEVPNLQGKTITSLGGFFPQVLNDALDRLTVIVQQVKEKVNRSLKVAISTADGFEATLPAPVPNQLIGWNSAGDGFQNYAGASATLVSSAMAPVVAAPNVASARSLLGSGITGDSLFLTNTAAAARAVVGAAASGAIGSSGLTMATGKVLLRSTAGTGAIEEGDVAGGISMSGGVLLAESPMFDIDASVAANALTITINPGVYAFRSSTLTDGTPVLRRITSALTLTVSNGSTLGTVNGSAARLAVLVLDNAGTLEAAVVNVAGGTQLDECNLISTTAEGGAGAADSASTVYSASARSSLAYRVAGFIDITQATAGTWASAPTLVQGAGGQAITSLQSLGYGQTWQDVTASRSQGTTYYNTTGKPIQVSLVIVATGSGQGSITVGGATLVSSIVGAGSATHQFTFVVPPGQTYLLTLSAGSFQKWCELR